jgi:hypothetical protein
MLYCRVMQVFIHNDFRVRKLGFIGELPWWCNGPMTAELGVRGPALGLCFGAYQVGTTISCWTFYVDR